MEKQKIDLFMATNGNKFPEMSQMLIREMLANADDTKFNIAMAMPYKDPTTLLIISVVAGGLGIDRFMLGQTGMGVGKLITTLLCIGFIWWIIDLFLIQKDTKEHNFMQLQRTLM